MPTRAARRCTTPGCPGLTREPGQTKCDDCAARSARAYDRQRGSAAARGYDATWQRRRASFLGRHRRCVDCGAPATVADHAPLSRRALIAAGVRNPDADRYLQPRCEPCHDRRTVAVDGGLGRPRR